MSPTVRKNTIKSYRHIADEFFRLANLVTDKKAADEYRRKARGFKRAADELEGVK